MSFKTGDKVVCINADWVNTDQREWNYPELNKVYTIEFVLHDGAITLVEVDNSATDRLLLARGVKNLAAFYSWHFRKLSEMPIKHLEEETLQDIIQLCECGEPCFG